MAAIQTAGQAVARVAFLSSDVVLSVQPALQRDSEFSSHLRQLSTSGVAALTSSGKPAEIETLRYNNDPFLSAYKPLREGKQVSVTTSSSTLVPAIPHLYKLAHYPLVIHVAVRPSNNPDYSDITAIRQCGFAFLQSETLQEAQDIAITAHALAARSGRGVVHFFDPANTKRDHAIELENSELLKSLLQPGSLLGRRGEAVTSSLYVPDGGAALLTESVTESTDPAAGQSDAPSPSENSKVPPKAPSNPASSQGSSVRESSADSRPSVSSDATSVEAVRSRPVQSEDILRFVEDIWAQIRSVTSRAYSPFEYTGPTDAENALFLFGSTGIFVDELEAAGPNAVFAKLGIVTARLYRPWIGNSIAEVIPPSVKRIAVLEQLRRRTTKWGPVLLDVLTSLRPDPSSGVPRGHAIIGHQLGYLERATAGQALQGIWLNLNSTTPIQNLEVGSSKPPVPDSDEKVEQPRVEGAYTKVLDQVFGNRLHVANRMQSSTAGVSASTAKTPEYGFGSLLARIEHRKRFKQEVAEAARSKEFITNAPAEWLAKWSLVADDVTKVGEIAADTVARLSTDGSRLASHLLESKGLFFKESNWLVGSDAWAYDLGSSGVHHVLESGANVNMLIIDSQPYSERAAADSTRRKKDIGLYAMNFGNAYVASVAVYGQYTQVLEAMIEADKFDGPSVVVAYLPYNKEDDSPLTVLQETKKAIDLGYWPLYRWNPRNEDNDLPNFTLDSVRIRKELEGFLQRDNHLTQLMRRHPNFSANLAGSYGSEVRALQKRNAKDAYEQMLEGLYGAPMTVLFASDNSNAANLAKRLANRGKARGLKTIVMEMDDYPIEDLPKEENVVLITSTAGQGEFPQNGRNFWEAVKNGADLDLAAVKFAVFALGDSHYWPRKEDKIYYNKPGKDLDTKLAFLGGVRLTEVGLGDDQDPDGYQTGYKEWEPKLWQALDVDKVEGIPDEPPPITNEDIKLESNYLRGTIIEGLNDESTGAISASDQQLTKFHGTYMQDDRDLRDERKAQGLEPAYSFMIRCRLNGGVATPDQWSRMSAIADELGNSTMKLTTRQTFQFHGVVKKKLKPAMQAINRAMMTTLAACGDVNRNLMVSTAVPTSKYHKDVLDVSARISDHLLPQTKAYHEIWLTDDDGKKTQVAGNALVDQPSTEEEPLYGNVYLPRKFKITLAIPPNNDTDVYAHDIGLIAIKGENGRLAGFNILAGGGMGVTHNNKKTYPRTGSMLGYVAAEKAHIVCEKIMLVQKDNGDRKNRKHARLKYTIDDMGVDVFRGKVEELLGYKFEDQKPFTFKSNVDTFGWQKDDEGLNHFTCFIENGRVEDTPDFPMKTGLLEIAKVLKGEFRLTGNQHLIVSNVTDSDKPQIANLLKKYKLDNVQFSGLRLSSSACVAFPTCGLAMAESERYLPELITKLEGCLEENGLRNDSIVMRMTGCPNGCARPWLAEIAFVGKAYGAYNMYLGGGYHGQRINKLYRSSINEEILEIVKPMFARYAKERNEGEHFGDWTIRAGIIKETKIGKEFHNDVAEEESDEE